MMYNYKIFMFIKRAFITAIFVAILIVCLANTGSASVVLEITSGPSSLHADHYSEGVSGEASAYLADDCLVQIIKLRTGAYIPNPPSNLGAPTGGDTLIGTSYVGENALTFIYPGAFDTSVTASQGNIIVVRAFNTSEVTKATFYGNSGTYEVTSDDPQFFNINGESNVPAFSTNIIFDTTPPGSPSNFKVTQEASGALIISWTPTNEPDAISTEIVWRTDRMPTAETDGSILTAIATSSASQAFKHTSLNQGQRYYYGGFSKDLAGNYSITAANSSEVSNDTTPPNWTVTVPTSDAVNVPQNTNINVTFNETMSSETSAQLLKVSGPSGDIPVNTLSWSGNYTTLTFDPMPTLAQSSWYTCTIDASVKDRAGNPMGTSYTWRFYTAAGVPPTITDLKIDGWKNYPGDIISTQPKISAYLNSATGFSGIASVEISVGAFPPQMYSGAALSEIYSTISGYFDARFPIKIPAGTYGLTVNVWDISYGLTQETISGLVVSGGAAKIIGPVVNYPYEVESGKGTTFAYTLSVNTNIEINIFAINGTKIFHKKIGAGSPGGNAGYNEVIWDGLDNFSNGIGTGIYLVYIMSGNDILSKSRVLIKNIKE